MPWRHFTASQHSPHLTRRRPTLELLESRCLLAAITMLDEEQLVLELINRARANPAVEAARLGIDLNKDLPPGTLSASPKPPLAPNQKLIDVAGAHSQDMITRNFFDHVNPDGKNPGVRMADAGYSAQAWGENIAIHVSATEAHDLLFLSAGHRKNMLNGAYRELGVGVRNRIDWGVDMTEAFGNRIGSAFLTGVAFSDQVEADNFFSVGEGLADVTITATARTSGAIYTTTTGPTGGYSLRVPSGTYDLLASGGELAKPIAVIGVGLATTNVKADFVVPYIKPGPPIANPDRVMTERDAVVLIDVLLNDAGVVASNPATVAIVSLPNIGHVVVDGATGCVSYTPAAGKTGPDAFTYRLQDADGNWSPVASVLVTVVDLGGNPWQNPDLPADVNADGRVAALDALVLITNINAYQPRALPSPSNLGDFPPAYWDVTGDGRVDPADVLSVINHINRALEGAGEGEASSSSGGIEITPVPTASALIWHTSDAAIQASAGSASTTPEANSPIWPAATPAVQLNLPMGPDRSRITAAVSDKPAQAEDDLLFSTDLLRAIDAIVGG